MLRKRIRVVVSILLILYFADAAAQTNCKLRKNQDSIKVYTCDSDTSKFKLIRAEFYLNATRDQLQNFLLDFPNYTTWQYSMLESKILKKISDTEYTYYTKIGAPWPVADRDMVVRFKVENNNNNMIVTANSERGVIPEKNECVRVPSSRSHWIVTQKSETKLFIKYEIQIDPGGYVPTWLINMVCANAPYLSFKNLKKQIGHQPFKAKSKSSIF